jgi:hypothetical protein
MVEDSKDAVAAPVLAEELSSEPVLRRCLIRNPGNGYVLTWTSERFHFTATPEDKVDPSQEWLVREADGLICPSGRSDVINNLIASWSQPNYWWELDVANSDDPNASQWTFTRSGQIKHRFSSLNLAVGIKSVWKNHFSASSASTDASYLEVKLERPSGAITQQWQLVSIVDDPKPQNDSASQRPC